MYFSTRENFVDFFIRKCLIFEIFKCPNGKCSTSAGSSTPRFFTQETPISLSIEDSNMIKKKHNHI